MQVSLRRASLQAGGSSLSRRATKRHLELLSAPPSVLTSVALVRKQSRLGRTLKRSGDIAFSLLALGLGSPMRADADAVLQLVLAESPEMRAEFERDFKLRQDPRITPIGRFLRRSSLDELPQFLNVLRGEMSVVGPRPIVDKEIERYGPFMDEVLAVRPGLTGLWQVSGRNNLSYAKRVRLDLAYSRGRSFLLDLAIILRTFGVLLLPMDRVAFSD